MNNYKTILFDFDYTIADSSNGIIICFNKALKTIGQKELSPFLIKKTIGKSLEEAFFDLSKVNSKSVYNIFRSKFIKYSKLYMVNNTKMYNNVEELFKLLKYNNCNIGIVTSKDKGTVLKIIEKNNCKKYVDIIIGENNNINPKPSKEPLKKAIFLLKSNPNDTLYIGDSIIDAETAQNANVDFFAVLSGVTTYNDFYLSGYNIKKYFNSIKDIINYLKGDDIKNE